MTWWGGRLTDNFSLKISQNEMLINKHMYMASTD